MFGNNQIVYYPLDKDIEENQDNIYIKKLLALYELYDKKFENNKNDKDIKKIDKNLKKNGNIKNNKKEDNIGIKEPQNFKDAVILLNDALEDIKDLLNNY